MKPKERKGLDARIKMGRPTKLTPDVQDGICQAIRGGLTYEQSATFNGIHAATFYNWKAKGEKAKSGKYFEFNESLKRANVAARAIHLQGIQKAAQGGETFEEVCVSEKVEIDPRTGNETVVARETKRTKKVAMPTWQARAWILERRFSSEFGRHITPIQPEERDPMQEWMDGLEEAERQFGNS